MSLNDSSDRASSGVSSGGLIFEHESALILASAIYKLGMSDLN